MDIGGKYGDTVCEAKLFSLFLQKDCKGIGLLSCGASGRPDPQVLTSYAALEKFRNNLFLKRLVDFGIAEKLGYPYQQVVVEQVLLVLVTCKHHCIICKGVELP